MSEWISVDDELPERGQQVLAWSESGRSQTPNLLLLVCFVDAGHWIYGHYNNNMSDVTHWQPLPEPPETA